MQNAARTEHGVEFVGHKPTCIPYAEVATRAARFAGALQALGVHAGDTVALVLPTGAAFYDAFFGAVWLGAIPVPLYPPQRLGKLEEFHARTAAMLTAIQARVVITDRRVHRLLGQAVERARPPLGCLCAEDMGGPAVDAALCNPDAIALIQFSSGTTVDPKPVVLTHRQLIANMHAVSRAVLADLGPRAEPLVAVSWLPLYHDMGLIGCMLTAVYEPTKMVLIPPEQFVAQPALWLQTISRVRGTISAAPNFAYNYCAERIRDADLAGVNLRSWHVAFNGAEPVTMAAMERFAARFAPYGFCSRALTPVYGLAEAALAVTFSSASVACKVLYFHRETLQTSGVAKEAHGGMPLVSLGRVLPGSEVRIVDDADRPVAHGHSGHVQVRGPSVMHGYYLRPDATSQALHAEGWLRTGDMGFFHDGELYLTGRSKDLIILNGRNHAPQDIEQHIDAVPGVRTGCAVAVSFVPEGAATEALLLLVERRVAGDDSALAEAVHRHVVSACGLVPAHVAILAPGTLPRTSSGKLRRQAALQQHLAGTLQAPHKATPWHLASAMARSALAFHRAHRDGGP